MRVAPGLLVVLLFAIPLAWAQEAGDGEEGPSLTGPARYTIDIALGEAGASLTLNPKELIIPPGAEVTFNVKNVGASDHDLTFINGGEAVKPEDVRPQEGGGADAIKTPLLASGESYQLHVRFPDEGAVRYICSVPGHSAAGMEGTLSVGGGGGAAAIEDYGVNYYAYWIGILSFVIVFVMLFGTFFLFRYGESKNVVDHRTGAAKAAAAGAEPSGHAHVEHRNLPAPSQFVKALLILAIIAFVLYQYTPLFKGE